MLWRWTRVAEIGKPKAYARANKAQVVFVAPLETNFMNEYITGEWWCPLLPAMCEERLYLF